MKTTNRISSHFADVEFLEALERTGAVRIEAPRPPLVAVGDIGRSYEPPPPPDFDYAHHVAGVGSVKDDGCGCDDEPTPSVPSDVSWVVCGLSFVGCALLLCWAALAAVVWRWMR